MSWHTSAIAIEGDHTKRGAALLAELGFAGLAPVGVVTGDGAGSSDLHGRAVGCVKGWTLVWDPTMFVAEDSAGVFEDSIWSRQLEDALFALSRAGGVFTFITEGASSTHGFASYRAGARVRLRLSQEGVIVMEDGNPLPEEISVFAEDADEEQALFALLSRVTGTTMDDLFAQEFQVYA